MPKSALRQVADEVQQIAPSADVDELVQLALERFEKKPKTFILEAMEELLRRWFYYELNNKARAVTEAPLPRPRPYTVVEGEQTPHGTVRTVRPRSKEEQLAEIRRRDAALEKWLETRVPGLKVVYGDITRVLARQAATRRRNLAEGNNRWADFYDGVDETLSRYHKSMIRQLPPNVQADLKESARKLRGYKVKAA